MGKKSDRLMAVIFAVLCVLAVVMVVFMVKLLIDRNRKTAGGAPESAVTTQSGDVSQGLPAQPEEKTAQDPAAPTSADVSPAQPASQASVPQPRFLTAGDTDIASLCGDYDPDAFLNALNVSAFDYDLFVGRRSYDVSISGARMDTKKLKQDLFFLCESPLYAYLFGDPEQVRHGENDDPIAGRLRGNGHYYVRYSEEKLNWIAKNVFNMSGAIDREAFMQTDTECVYLDGYFYFAFLGFDHDPTPWGKIVDTVRNADGSYRFTVAYRMSYEGAIEPFRETGVLTAALIEADGKRVWNIIDYSAVLSDPKTAAAPQQPQAARTVSEDEAREIARAYWSDIIGNDDLDFGLFVQGGPSTGQDRYTVALRRKVGGHWTTDDTVQISLTGEVLGPG